MRWMAAPASALRTVFRKPLLLLLNLAGVPALVAAFWGWLYIPVSSVLLVIVSLATLAVLVTGLLLMMSYTYSAYYAEQHPLQPVSSQGIRLPSIPVAKRSLRALPALLGWFAVFGLLCGSITWLGGFTIEWAKPVASWATMLSQQPVTFLTVNAVFVWTLDFVRWVVLPLVFFASFAGFATAAVRKGRKRAWQGHALRNIKNPLYWAGWLAFAGLGLWLPAKLIGWVPAIEGIPAATASMVARFGVAMAVAIVCWLVFLSLLARLTKQPRESLIVLSREARSRPA
jgi:hypothetical protein